MDWGRGVCYKKHSFSVQGGRDGIQRMLLLSVQPMVYFPALLAVVVMPAFSLGLAQSAATLASLRHNYRPLLVFAASENEEVREQVKLLAAANKDMQERQVVMVPIFPEQARGAAEGKDGLPQSDVVRLAPGEDAKARRRFHVGADEFVVILVGKDGGEKLRLRSPVTMERLNNLIDMMPMRQKEARDGHSG